MSPPAARGPQTPPYAYRMDLEDTHDRVARAEERLESVEQAHGIDTATILDKFETHEKADADRHREVLDRLDRLTDRVDSAIRDAAGARALAERQPSQAEAVLIEEKRDELAAAKERRTHFWAAVRRVGGWVVGGGGAGAIVLALTKACGGG